MLFSTFDAFEAASQQRIYCGTKEPWGENEMDLLLPVFCDLLLWNSMEQPGFSNIQGMFYSSAILCLFSIAKKHTNV